MWAGLKQTLLAVEVSGDIIRAALVEKRGRRFDVIDVAAMSRPDPRDDLPSVDAVKALAERLQHTMGKVVFVTPMARTFDLVMDRDKVKDLSAAQLKEAVKWEVEPYTGITGTNALIGVEPVKTAKTSHDELNVLDEDIPVSVSVSAMERNVYRALKARFKVAGFRLVRVYPPDVTFFMVPAVDGTDSPRAVLEIGEDYSNFALLDGRVPKQISTLSLSRESIAAHVHGEMASVELEESLRFMARQIPGPEPLIVTGVGAGDKDVVDFVASFCPGGAVPLVLARKAQLTGDRDNPSNAAYAGTAGAAVRELLGRRERSLGIDDREDPVQKLKKSAYIIPLATSLFMAVLLFVHYGYMKHKEDVYETQIKTLKAQLSERKAAVAEYQALLREDRELEEQIEFMERKLAFVRGKADDDVSDLIDSLDGMADAVTRQVMLAGIVQNSPTEFTVTGSTFDLSGISGYTAELQKRPWCVAAELVSLKAADGGRHSFELKVTTGKKEGA
ncbi:hypothetical protein JCM14469_25050 [Desulfatiferula olefinivorans]